LSGDTPMDVNIRKFAELDRQYCRSLWRELVEWHIGLYKDQQIGGNTPEDFFDRHLSIVGPERQNATTTTSTTTNQIISDETIRTAAPTGGTRSPFDV
jgi:hypothetical protein